jgi:photosystem II stability/assembly factor-like uncharacterized protein
MKLFPVSVLLLVLTAGPAAAQLAFEPILGPYPPHYFLTWETSTDGQGNYYITDEKNIIGDKPMLLHSPDGRHWTLRDFDAGRRHFVGRDGQVYALNGLQLERSADHGQSWITVNASLPVAATRLIADEAGRLVLYGQGHVFRSTDGGLTWSAVLTLPAEPYQVDELYYFPGSASVWLRHFANDTLRLWRSTDQGASWEAVYERAAIPWGRTLQEGPDGALYFDLGGDGNRMAYSTDGGNTWGESAPAPGTPAQITTITPLNDNTVVAGINNGNWYRSFDHGASWEIAALPEWKWVSKLRRLADGTVFATSARHELFQVEYVNAPLVYAGFGLVDPKTLVWPDPSIILMPTNLGVTRWINGAPEFLSILPYTEYICNYNPLTVGPDQSWYLNGCRHLLRSADGGVTYDTLLDLGPGTVSIQRVAVANGYLYVMTDYKLYRSGDGGASWQVANSPEGIFHRLAVSAEGRVYVQTEYPATVYRSDNNGASFIEIQGGWPYILGEQLFWLDTAALLVSNDYGETYQLVGTNPVAGQYVYNYNTWPELVVGTASQIFAYGLWEGKPVVHYSFDGGLNWERTFFPYAPWIAHFNFFLLGADGYLYASLGASTAEPITVMRSTEPLTGLPSGLSETAENARRLQVFPNPFTEQISIQLPASADGFTMELHDAWGRQVARMPATPTVALPKLAPGLYFLSLYTPSRELAAKARVLKL